MPVHSVVGKMGDCSTSGVPLSPALNSMDSLTEPEKLAIRSYVGLVQAGVTASAESLVLQSEADSIWAGSNAFYYIVDRVHRLRDQTSDDGIKNCLDAKLEWLTSAWHQRSASDDYMLRPALSFECLESAGCGDLPWWQEGSSAEDDYEDADAMTQEPEDPTAEHDTPAEEGPEVETPSTPGAPAVPAHQSLQIDFMDSDEEAHGVKPVRNSLVAGACTAWTCHVCHSFAHESSSAERQTPY